MFFHRYAKSLNFSAAGLMIFDLDTFHFSRARMSEHVAKKKADGSSYNAWPITCPFFIIDLCPPTSKKIPCCSAADVPLSGERRWKEVSGFRGSGCKEEGHHLGFHPLSWFWMSFCFMATIWEINGFMKKCKVWCSWWKIGENCSFIRYSYAKGCCIYIRSNRVTYNFCW